MSKSKGTKKSASTKPAKGTPENPFRLSPHAEWVDLDIIVAKPGVWEWWDVESGSAYGKGKINYEFEETCNSPSKAKKVEKSLREDLLNRAKTEWEWDQKNELGLTKRNNRHMFTVTAETKPEDVDALVADLRKEVEKLAKKLEKNGVEPFVAPEIHTRVVHRVVVVAEEVVS